MNHHDINISIKKIRFSKSIPIMCLNIDFCLCSIIIFNSHGKAVTLANAFRRHTTNYINTNCTYFYRWEVDKAISNLECIYI